MKSGRNHPLGKEKTHFFNFVGSYYSTVCVKLMLIFLSTVDHISFFDFRWKFFKRDTLPSFTVIFKKKDLLLSEWVNEARETASSWG
jgi:hypothetical protein